MRKVVCRSLTSYLGYFNTDESYTKNPRHIEYVSYLANIQTRKETFTV